MSTVELEEFANKHGLSIIIEGSTDFSLARAYCCETISNGVSVTSFGRLHSALEPPHLFKKFDLNISEEEEWPYKVTKVLTTLRVEVKNWSKEDIEFSENYLEQVKIISNTFHQEKL